MLALTALANGLGNNIMSNYFNEVFHIDSVQRGFIEVPRESPGILCMVRPYRPFPKTRCP